MTQMVKLTFGDSLAMADIRAIRTTLSYGGLCVLPSDTGYSLAALPFSRTAVTNLRAILDRPSEPISLAFGSFRQIERYMHLTAEDERIIDHHCPGPVTLVCVIRNQPNENFAEKLSTVISADGTVGIRLPDSPVERQICIEIDRPITTAAIRYPNQHIVQKFDDAFQIVIDRVNELNIRTAVTGVKMRRIKYTDQSTVVTVEPALAAPYVIREYRAGVVDIAELQDTVRRISLSDAEDWT